MLAQRRFLTRIQEYNEIWKKAEEHVDGLLAAKGLRPGMHFPYIGVPPVIKRASEGDPEAIAEIKETLAPHYQRDRDWGKPWAIDNVRTPLPVDHSGYDFGKVFSVTVSLLLAFASVWMCLCLVVGPKNVAELVRVQSEDKTPSDCCELSPDGSHHAPRDEAATRHQDQNFSDTSSPRPLTRSVRSTIFFPAFSSVFSASG